MQLFLYFKLVRIGRSFTRVAYFFLIILKKHLVGIKISYIFTVLNKNKTS